MLSRFLELPAGPLLLHSIDKVSHSIAYMLYLLYPFVNSVVGMLAAATSMFLDRFLGLSYFVRPLEEQVWRQHRSFFLFLSCDLSA